MDGWAAASWLDLLHLHDLRNLAGTLVAMTGAGPKELIYRLGHASPQAVLGYQHATKTREVAIADAMDALIAARPMADDAAADSQGHATATRTFV